MICRFEKSIFRSADGYCIFGYRTRDESVPQEARNTRFHNDGKIHITAVGYHLPDTAHMEVDLSGTWQSSRYGLQLSVEKYETIIPRHTDGLIAYLSSGLIRGIGPETAKAIVKQFGSQTLEILEKDPQQLLTVKGIARTRLKAILQSYEETRSIRDLTAYLSPYGVTLRKIMKIRETFGENSLTIVQNNPFMLCQIQGFGFLTVDAIARKTSVSLKHPLRYAGTIQYVLEEAQSSGHLFLTAEKVLEACHGLLNRDCEHEIISRMDVQKALQNEHRAGRVYMEGTRVYLPFERFCEVESAKKLAAMLPGHSPCQIRKMDREIQQSERKLEQTLSESQKNAVKCCLSSICSIMTGGPGTGKTTTLRVILDVYRRMFPEKEILLAAPTGKASRRMEEQTGYSASTLHSALGILQESDIRKDRLEPLTADFVVVDEFSMVDMRLAYALLKGLKPKAQLLIVGDPDQLPSVGPGNVLRELIRSRLIPVAVLDTVFRQAFNSRIALNAHAIHHNDTQLLYGDDFILLDAEDGEDAAEKLLQCYRKEVTVQGMENVQVLTPFRRRGAVSADRLNLEIQEMMNPKRSGVNEIRCGGKTFREGDRIIQIRNRDGVNNGDTGIITRIAEDAAGEKQIHITLLDGKQLIYTLDMMEDIDLGYCISIHKSQGSEFATAIIPLLKEQYIMLRRNLLYTAVSRAKSKVVLIGQKQAVYMAIHKNDVDQRNTVLADRITAYYNRKIKKNAV